MRFANKLFVVASLIPVLGMASPFRPKPPVLPNIVTMSVEKVGTQGQYLKETQSHPYTDYLIGIPVQVQPDDACTLLIGQEVTTVTRATGIRAVGTKNPMTDVCIDVMPQPVDTMLSFTMHVLTGGIVEADRFQTETVRIQGKGLYQVTLDLNDTTVTVRPLFKGIN